MPNIVFSFESLPSSGGSGTGGGDSAAATPAPFPVTMLAADYVDSVGNGKYAFRIYLSEPSGFLLGANFMNGHNIIFDQDGGRVGFARSKCKEDSRTLAGSGLAPNSK